MGASVLRLLAVTALLALTSGQRQARQVIFPDDDDGSEPAVEQTGSSCRTPNNQPGKCVNIDNCPELSRDPNFENLRRFVCGYENLRPRLCCPVARGTTSGPTRRPTTRPTLRPTRPTRPTPTPTSRPVTRTQRPPVTRTQRPPITSTMPFLIEQNTGSGPSFLPRMCGRTNTTATRIVGGQEAELNSWPWIVAIYFETKTADCGGALVTQDIVVTAAHCVTEVDGSLTKASTLTARLGEHDLSSTQDGANPLDVSVARVIRHENFESRTFKNDIAILKLSRKVQYDIGIQPICLPYGTFPDLTGRKAFVAGWGATSYDGPTSSKLLQAQIPIWSFPDCTRAYESETKVTDVYLCAGVSEGGIDSCQGDSGGPLMIADVRGRFSLIGVVSFGKKCATPGFPGVYTNVRKFLPWLTKNMSP